MRWIEIASERREGAVGHPHRQAGRVLERIRHREQQNSHPDKITLDARWYAGCSSKRSGGDMYQRFAILLSAGALAVTVACSQTDAGVTSAVKSKMATDDTVKASEINVDTHEHVVTLNGTVGSKAEKDRALMIARNTKGVNSVIDDLRVGPVATSGSLDRDRDADRDRDYSESAKQTARDAKDKTETTAHDAKVKTERAAEKT